MKKFPFEIIYEIFYFFSVLGISAVILPDDAFVLFGGKPRNVPDSFLLTVAGISLAIGICLHLIVHFFKLNKCEKRVWIKANVFLICFLAGVFILSMILSRFSGFSPLELYDMFHKWFLCIVIGLVALPVFLIILYVFILIVSIKFKSANRMARCIAAGDYSGAIRLGEAVSVEKQDFPTKVNLALAYAHSDQKEKAKEILYSLEKIKEVPQYCTEEVKQQFLDILRNAITQDGKIK